MHFIQFSHVKLIVRCVVEVLKIWMACFSCQYLLLALRLPKVLLVNAMRRMVNIYIQYFVSINLNKAF